MQLLILSYIVSDSGKTWKQITEKATGADTNVLSLTRKV